MPFRITASKSQSFFAYILSLVGLDIFANTTRRRYSAPSIQSTVPSLSNSHNSSVLTESTLLVNPHDYYDDTITKQSIFYEPWALDTWVCELPKVALVGIVSRIAQHFPGLIEDAVAAEQTCVDKAHERDSLTNTSLAHVQELDAIRKQAHAITHRLDGLRPSEQFARADEITHKLQQLVRLCIGTMHAPAHGHSILALLGLLIIAQKSFDAPSEVRQHVYYHGKFGRVVILEMANVLKNFKGESLSRDELALDLELRHWRGQLRDVCARMAKYDTEWSYRKEYENVVSMIQ